MRVGALIIHTGGRPNRPPRPVRRPAGAVRGVAAGFGLIISVIFVKIAHNPRSSYGRVRSAPRKKTKFASHLVPKMKTKTARNAPSGRFWRFLSSFSAHNGLTACIHGLSGVSQGCTKFSALTVIHWGSPETARLARPINAGSEPINYAPKMKTKTAVSSGFCLHFRRKSGDFANNWCELDVAT